MIKFFRKIRQNLLKENNTSKYFKYAIGEILLVVIGILIALQINNWNENRKLLLQQDLLFEQLLSDTKADSIFFLDRLDGLHGLDSTLNAIREFGDNPNFDISTINLNGTGRVFPMTSFRYSSNLLENNKEVYNQLIDFDIKSQLRAYRAKYSYVASAFIRINKELEADWTKFSKRYYKELRENKETKSIEALKTIYQDEDIQASIDVIKGNSEVCKRRTKELLVLNKKLAATLLDKIESQ